MNAIRCETSGEVPFELPLVPFRRGFWICLGEVDEFVVVWVMKVDGYH